ncbi:MAG: leucine-rich repeat domain-containing protein [Flavobacteriales bacterium]
MKSICISLCILTTTYASSAQETDSLTQTPDSLHTYTSIAEALKHPDLVFYLDLSKQKLKEFPAEIFTFKNLVSLDLSRNKIAVIPAEITSLKNLEELNLSRNKIKEMPAALFDLKHLKKLILNQNLIESIPSEIRKLEQLEYLDMWSNELAYFPNEMSQLKKLKEFDLRNIQINQTEQQRLSKLLPETKIHFSQSCNCGN